MCNPFLYSKDESHRYSDEKNRKIMAQLSDTLAVCRAAKKFEAGSIVSDYLIKAIAAYELKYGAIK